VDQKGRKICTIGVNQFGDIVTCLCRLESIEAAKEPDTYEQCDACPNCSHIVERYLWGDSTRIGETGEWTDTAEYDMNYCPECGQKLKWE